MTTVLVVEDDRMIAEFLQQILADAGYSVCGVAGTVNEAVKMGNDRKPDLAIMDLRLAHGELSTSIVPRLEERSRMGILYATGNDNNELTSADGDASISKPYMIDDLMQALHVVEEVVAGHGVSTPLPPGMRMLGGATRARRPQAAL